jgi:Domain of unknown function (DUF932)
MSRNLTEAYAQWAKRSPDESFSSLADLFAFTASRKDNSSQSIRDLRELHTEATQSGSLVLNGSERPAALTHWSLGQLASHIGAPASYLRSLSPELAQQCMEYGLKNSARSCNTLYRMEGNSSGNSSLVAAAFTGPSYGRIWDADVVGSLIEATDGSSWKTPAELSEAHSGHGTGLYASDRDMFAFMVNEEDTVDVEGAKLGRGFFCWNSETGSSTFGLTTFLYNYVCANHIVWGAEQVSEINIYHRSQAQGHFNREAIPALNKYVRDTSMGDEIKSMVRATRQMQLGDDLENITKRLTASRFTKSEIESAWSAAEKQNEDPRSAWGMVQGLTAIAQEIPYIDKRVNLERRASKLLEVH